MGTNLQKRPLNRKRRDAVIRNLHRLGCPQPALADGFCLSSQAIGLILIGPGRPGRWRNACPVHRNVMAYCRSCVRVPAEAAA